VRHFHHGKSISGYLGQFFFLKRIKMSVTHCTRGFFSGSNINATMDGR
jgi:hypothetical protein